MHLRFLWMLDMRMLVLRMPNMGNNVRMLRNRRLRNRRLRSRRLRLIVKVAVFGIR
jgi:hypothetical protein